MLLKVRVIFVQAGVGIEGAKCRSASWCLGTACWEEFIAQINLSKMEDGERQGKEKQYTHI